MWLCVVKGDLGVWPFMSQVVTLFGCTPIFEWFMTGTIIKNAHQEYMCYNEIGLRARNT